MSESVDRDVVVISNVPSNKANMRLLLVSGKKSDFLVDPKDTIEKVTQHIFQNWPTKGWAGETIPDTAANIKLLLRGKFLERTGTIECKAEYISYAIQNSKFIAARPCNLACGIPIGDTTVVHLLVKNNAPAATDEVQQEDKKTEQVPKCQCILL